MNAPKLRFKGFNDEWKLTLLSNLMSFSNGINADKDSYGHGRKFINVLDILNNNSIKYDDIIGSVFVSQKVEQTNKVEYGDLLFLRSSETRDDIGKSSVYLDKNEFALYGGFVIRGKRQKEYNPYFLKLNLESPGIRHQISSKAGGSTRFNVSQSILSSVEVSLPSQMEQEKIADFICHLDKKMQLQKEKIELLKEKKKGFIQKIFNQELRFKDENGKEYPEWQFKKLGEIGEFKTSSVDKVIKNSEEQVYLLNYMDVYNHKVVNINNYRTLTKNSASSQQIVTNNLKKGDIIFTPSSETPEDIGHSIVIPTDLPNTVYSYHLIRFRPYKSAQLDIKYSHFFCNTDLVRKQIIKHATGSTRFTVSKENFSNILVPLPSKKEQQNIAEFLMLLDKQIKNEKERLTVLGVQKQAFMRNMFI
ncbi:hypothetical protein G3A_14260 [Bacillus sp. 17376]|uniref:Type I restriction-modification system n=1 Tax=Mesobacillus boroniphilus JCM 21738 TaxID=1294265 RepID=W4RUQ5_9BACI|nr:restriction endonuclease subunit S [Mesobacillus boroniphilus]ESU31879.1 hypothetical protein G3A_14260 [Bacillus sp. 17376]GAE48026.1 type I restriction-modification system [Mesobacillus boroniphilus JCM 21738]